MLKWLGWKPFWLGERGCELSFGCRRYCKTLAVPKSASLPGLGAGIIIACFQMARILQLLTERL